KLNISKDEGRALAKMYGTNVDIVYRFLENVEGELPPTLYGQLMYAIHYEMTLKPVDFFIRRTGDLLFNIHLVEMWKAQVMEEMSSIYNWSEEEKRQYEDELNQELSSASVSI